MTSRVYADSIANHLTEASHTNAVRQTAWTPGFRVHQASLYTVRVWHDGPDEQTHLDQYADVLAALGYHVTKESAVKTPGVDLNEDPCYVELADLAVDKRPSIKATRT